ncbi:hypothetical protein ACFQX7_09065 [Luedemannella flava]
MQNLGNDHAGDLSEFLSLDPADEACVGEGRELGTGVDEEEAILLAERLTSATADRWVNYAVAGRTIPTTSRTAGVTTARLWR